MILMIMRFLCKKLQNVLLYESIFIFRYLDYGYAEEPALALSLCFTLHGAGKGTDRFYAWQMLSPTEKEWFYVGFLIWIYIAINI
ncbi:hypothetical protein ACIGHG_02005 [Bacillus sp. NPDC077411]|uniref:hypothetical protein n=1 Tax=Bacillus sp. NPDC077411 TaxID=3363947 RepID=UPI0037C8FA90